MKRPLLELKALSEYFQCPNIVAGDVFDKWNSSAELINFALKTMPEIHAIPGQHDLPLHNYDDIRKSAYWTLVEAGKIKNLFPGKLYRKGDLLIQGFPWNYEITPIEDTSDLITLAVIHSYCWKGKCKYPGADDKEKIGAYKKQLAGFDCAVFGDNHIGFSGICGDCEVINTGSLMRQKSDQREYKPRVGLLLRTGEIEEYYLGISHDAFQKKQDLGFLAEDEVDMEELIKELEQLGDASLNFKQSIETYCKKNKVSKNTKKVLLSVLDRYE